MKLHNSIQAYSWGSTKIISHLLGNKEANNPQAELWMGAHSKASSKVKLDGKFVPLDDLIRRLPEYLLGKRIYNSYKGLPFLLKVLAVAKPLSIQVHPMLSQALNGFYKEEQLQIPIDSPHRNYRDKQDKPELIVAIEPYSMLVGFKSYDQIINSLKQFDIAPLKRALYFMHRDPNKERLRRLISLALQLSKEDRFKLVDEIVSLSKNNHNKESKRIRELANEFPGDIGVLGPLLLNMVDLAPGEGVFVGAGLFHTSLSGTAIELQANSDNVIRGGLTSKHVDIHEIIHIGDFNPHIPTIITGNQHNSEEYHYYTAAKEFALSEIVLGGLNKQSRLSFLTNTSPEILFVLEGNCVISDSNSVETNCKKGESVIVPACIDSFTLKGSGKIFRAKVPT